MKPIYTPLYLTYNEKVNKPSIPMGINTFSMQKDNKAEANPQVIKANTSAIKLRIKSNCAACPLTFDYERTDVSRGANRQVDLDFYNNPVFAASWTYNQQRSAFIYQVIGSKSYYNKDGNRLKISEVEIFETFTKLFYSLQEIDQFTHCKEFEEYLYGCYEEVLAEEQEERLRYDNASLLDKLLMSNSTPDLICRSMKMVTDSIRKVDNELRNLYLQLKYREVAGADFDLLREPLDNRLERLRSDQEYLTARYKRMTETSKYRRRHFLKMAFADVTRSLNHTHIPPVECRTVSLCDFYIREYCRWFNRTLKQEIATTRTLRKKAKRKTSTKRNERLELLRPYLDTSLSYRKIAQETGIPKSTVRRLMEELV